MAKNQATPDDGANPSLKVKISQAVRMVIKCIKAKKVPMIHGSPAIGKSGIVHQIADQYNLMLIDLRLSQCDPTDLLGFPQIIAAINRCGYTPMETFPIEGDEFPINPKTKEPYAGWLLFLDEFNSASVAVQAAAYKITLDRMVGKYHLHSKVAVVAAGNLETDGAIVEQMSTALQSRIVHLELMVDLPEWLVWAGKNGIDYRIMSYLEFKPPNLYTFKPDHNDRTYAAPRTWSFADAFLKEDPHDDVDMLPLLSGCITEGVAREFLNFCDIFDKLPKISEIVMAPEVHSIPNEPSILYAICGSIAQHASKDNIGPLIKYIKRLKIEFQIVAVRMTLARNRMLANDPEVQNWLAKHAEELF